MRNLAARKISWYKLTCLLEEQISAKNPG